MQPRFFTTWASALLLMSAAIKDMSNGLDRVTDVAPTNDRQLLIHPGQTQGTSYQIRVSECVDASNRIIHDADMPLALGIPSYAPCRVDARRLDGDLWTPWTIQQGVTGESVHLDLQVARAAGIGVTFVPRSNGAVVRDVYSGLPGSNMGLENGDIVTTVNGRSLAGLSDEQMVALITGPENSYIDLGIINVRDGRPLRRSTHRAFVDVSDNSGRLIPIIRR